MAYKNSAKHVVAEFLRTNLTDPRSRAETVESDTFSGTGASQTLTLSPSNNAYCITSVVDAGTTLNKWEDYDLDLQNGNVSGTFTSGSNNVVVSYKNGSTNWIYPNPAKETLSSTSYPRINVGIVSDSGIRIGTEAGTPADIYETIRFQVDIWVKERYTYSDGTITHAGPHLAMYLARQMIKAFEDSIGELYPLLHDFELINLTDAKWEVDREVFHVIVEFSLEGSSVAG